MPLDVGVVILPDLSWAEARERWQDAERRGFTAAWTYDHLSWRALRDEPWLGAVPLLAAVASVTSTLRLGTLVASPNYRHPATLAKEAMTLDQVSGGRFGLGVGAGGRGYDATALGQAPLSLPERAARFEEFVDALDLLLREPAASYEGQYFTAVESRTYPGCVQSPRLPFTIGAAGPRALRVAARHAQTWVTFGPEADVDAATWFDSLAAQSAAMAAACESVGRDPLSLRRAALVGLERRDVQDSMAQWDDMCGRVTELGFTDVIVHWPRPHDAALPGPAPAVFDEICARL